MGRLWGGRRLDSQPRRAFPLTENSASSQDTSGGEHVVTAGPGLWSLSASRAPVIQESHCHRQTHSAKSGSARRPPARERRPRADPEPGVPFQASPCLRVETEG